MLDRLAIVIIGEQNSGKTSTLREYSDYYHKPVNTLKKGFRYGVTPFKPKFWSVKIFTYILPSSPTESGIPLKDTIDPHDWYPDLLLMAEQTNGVQYSKSIHYLMGNEYHVKQFNISKNIGNEVWDRWNDGDVSMMKAKLLQRREEIAEYIRKFIISKMTL